MAASADTWSIIHDISDTQNDRLGVVLMAVGMAALLARTELSADVMNQTFQENKMRLPLAPGIGLLLDQVLELSLIIDFLWLVQ